MWAALFFILKNRVELNYERAERTKKWIQSNCKIFLSHPANPKRVKITIQEHFLLFWGNVIQYNYHTYHYVTHTHNRTATLWLYNRADLTASSLCLRGDGQTDTSLTLSAPFRNIILFFTMMTKNNIHCIAVIALREFRIGQIVCRPLWICSSCMLMTFICYTSAYGSAVLDLPGAT